MIAKIRSFVKKETVLCISALCAVATMFFYPPDAGYVEYIDLRVLCLLFCLMAVVAGFKSAGVFNSLTYQLLNKIKNGKVLSVALILLPFFSSMLVTNDVALIIFIPFTIALLAESGCKKAIIPVTVLQTVAANLGSMATPVGNPQNLYLYSTFNLSAKDFFSATLPLTLVSLVGLTLACLPVLPKKLAVSKVKHEKIRDKKYLLCFVILFLFSILSVFRVVPYQLLTPVTVAVIIILDRKLFKEIDFMLLLTFVCFFIISGNLGKLDTVQSFLQQLLEKSTLLTSCGASQIISNVPAAVLLSGFTDNWKELLMGVNIGGLGTPVASLASLITLKFYTKSPEAKTVKFLAVFSAVNIIGLVILLAFTLI